MYKSRTSGPSASEKNRQRNAQPKQGVTTVKGRGGTPPPAEEQPGTLVDVNAATGGVGQAPTGQGLTEQKAQAGALRAENCRETEIPGTAGYRACRERVIAAERKAAIEAASKK